MSYDEFKAWAEARLGSEHAETVAMFAAMYVPPTDGTPRTDIPHRVWLSDLQTLVEHVLEKAESPE